MKWLCLTISIISLLAVSSLTAQCPDIPEQYNWRTAEDYERDKDLVLKTLRWLCKTPLGEEVQQRSLANAYVLEWLAGTPSLITNIQTSVLPCASEHEALLHAYIHGVALYQLEHPKEKDNQKQIVAGLDVVVYMISRSKKLSKERCFKRLRRASRRDKLPEYVQKRV